MTIPVDGASRARGDAETFAFRPSETLRFFGFFALAAALALAFLIGCSLYEWSALGEHQLGMRKPPFDTPYYLGRFVVAALLSALIVAGLYSLRAKASAIDSVVLTRPARATAFLLLAVAAACAALFCVDPQLFNRLSLEDHSLEWISALLPLAASVGFAAAFFWVKRSPPCDIRRGVALALCALLAFALFVIGMEEISWMQRLFAIPTPALFAENQQQEMNLHNMHSIVIGQTYKALMFVALVLLPFVIDMAPRHRLLDTVSDFMPSRFVFAISAPWVAFNYNEWNFLASQMFVTLTLAILACYLKAAWDRRDSGEIALFGLTAAFILLAQPLFLVLGARFVRMWDASEYVELFIALGLTFYAAETLTRLSARYGAKRTPTL